MDTRISPAVGLAQRPQQASTAPLRVGEVLEARVLTQSGNQVSLKIGQQVLSALVVGRQVDIAPGAKFEVVRLEPIPVLKITNPNPSAKPSATGRFLRESLPTQAPIRALFSMLSETKNARLQIASNSIEQAKSNLLVRTINSIDKHAVALRDIATSDGLRAAIKNSGVFFENQLPLMLTNNAKHLSFLDFKATLLRAREGLRSAANLQLTRVTQAAQGSQTTQATPPTNVDESLGSLLKTVEAGLARIETLQFANHALASAGQNDIYLELPIRIGNQVEAIRLLIEQEQPSSEEDTLKEQFASIYLEVPLSDNESLQAKVSVKSGNFSIMLWSENERIQERLRGSAANLETALAANAVANATIMVQRFHNNMLDPAQLFTDLVSETA